MEFRVLGDLEVRAAGLPVDVGHARQRAVLAVLLFDLGRVVSVSQLIDRVWGDAPPISVRNVLYGYIAKLKAVIDKAGDPAVTLSRQPSGYRLEADRDQVDLYRFRRLVADAAATAGDDDRVGALLAEAVALWRGPALAGVDSAWLNGMRESLELQRRTAILDLGDITLRQGQHQALAASLAEEAVTCPADERLIGQLMLALYRSGCQAEALERFEQTRRRLAEEFGADPGPALQVLHRQILRADPSLTMPRATHNGRTWPVLRQLPADVSAFTGRIAELAKLSKLLPSAPISPVAATSLAAGTPVRRAQETGTVISVIAGTAGVGKTALAVHWAHEAAAQFPDGQLYIDLRGHGPGQALTAAEALAGFLRALGVPGQDIPAGTGERAARYRSLLAGRRMLVVLDNACSAGQVRPLLPGAPACAALVTSRDSLAGLVARHDAVRLDLDVLPMDDAVNLLRALIGGQVDAEPEGARALAGRCGRLPLALHAAAGLAAVRPGMSLADLAGEPGLRLSRAPRIPWSGRAGRLVRLAGAGAAAASLTFAAVFWGGLPAGRSLHHGRNFPVTRTSPNGTVLRDGVNPVRAACGHGAVTLASVPVRLPSPVSVTIQQRSTNTVVAGHLQLRFSAACHSTWARFEPTLAGTTPALRMLLWQIRTNDSRRLEVQAPTLRVTYTAMLMTGHDCVLAGVFITLRAGPQSFTATRCVTARPGPGART